MAGDIAMRRLPRARLMPCYKLVVVTTARLRRVAATDQRAVGAASAGGGDRAFHEAPRAGPLRRADGCRRPCHAPGRPWDLERERPQRRGARRGERSPEAYPVMVVTAEQVSNAFHARLSAVKRSYLYRILNRRSPPGLEVNRVWHVQPLDAAMMHEEPRRFSSAATISYDVPTAECRAEASPHPRPARRGAGGRRDPHPCRRPVLPASSGALDDGDARESGLGPLARAGRRGGARGLATARDAGRWRRRAGSSRRRELSAGRTKRSSRPAPCGRWPSAGRDRRAPPVRPPGAWSVPPGRTPPPGTHS